MTEQDRAQFAAIMTGLAENFGGNLSNEGLDFRFTALSRFSIEQVRDGAVKCVETRRYRNMPTIAEIIECIEGGADDHKIEAEKQAQEVLMAVRRHGRYANVLFADPVTNAVVKALGGWCELCNQREEDEKWFVKNFVEDYPKYKARGVEDKEPLRGIGTSKAVELVGFESRRALEGNAEGLKRLSALVGDI